MFVSGYVKPHFETVAYRAATGARLWAAAYQAENFSNPVAITVSPDGARVYVTGLTMSKTSQGGATIAYGAGTGRQLWASQSGLVPGAVSASALALSSDGATVYMTGAGRVSGSRQSEFAVIAYAAATGKRRWLRRYTKEPGGADSVAVSPDGKTVYATGSASSDALTVAYGASGTLKWAARYKNPYPGVAAGSQIVAGPGGGVVYVGGVASNKAGHSDIATFAYRAATGEQLWLDRYSVHARAGATNIAVTPGGRTVIVTGSRNTGNDAYAMAAYNTSTGRTRWTRLAPAEDMLPAGLVIDPLGDTIYVGGNRTAAYSVAHGRVSWMTGYTYGSGIFGLGSDGTRLFGTRSIISRGIITVANRT